MYSVEVRDRIMIGHSLPDPFFGPAQNMHGATFVVDVAFFRETLNRQNVVVDIGAARVELRRVLDALDYRNLDEVPGFAGQNTTTEFLCHHIHGALCDAMRDGRLGEGGRQVTGLKVLLRESPLAWAAYEAPVEPAPAPAVRSA